MHACLCVYQYIHAHTHTHAHAHAHARTHTRTHTRTPARTHARTHARAYARTHAHTHARTHTRTHARTRTHTRTHAHTRTNISQVGGRINQDGAIEIQGAHGATLLLRLQQNGYADVKLAGPFVTLEYCILKEVTDVELAGLFLMFVCYIRFITNWYQFVYAG